MTARKDGMSVVFFYLPAEEKRTLQIRALDEHVSLGELIRKILRAERPK